MKSHPILGIGLALGALGAGAYVMLGGSLPHMPALSGSRRRRISLRGEAESDELKLYIDNDGDLYRQQTQPIINNLKKKLAKGVFDKAKSEKLWMYLVESGAKKYVREFGGGFPDQVMQRRHGGGTIPWHKMFSMADRKRVARELAEDFVREYAEG